MYIEYFRTTALLLCVTFICWANTCPHLYASWDVTTLTLPCIGRFFFYRRMLELGNVFGIADVGESHLGRYCGNR